MALASEQLRRAARPRVSIIVATRNRAGSLAEMLRTLDGAVHSVQAPVEVIVVDNGSDDSTPQVLERWRDAGEGRFVLRVPERGKARALNAALRSAHGELVAFTDDDVEVPREWLGAVLDFMDRHPEYAAITGRTTLPPQARHDSVLLAQVALYRTLPLFDLGREVRDTTHLYGCNMALRRSIFAAIGMFDERLGPGASGLHEDGDLAERVQAAGLRIAYVPQMEMHHSADPARLTWDFFVYLHRADARSRAVQRGSGGMLRAAQHWFGAALLWLWWGLLRNRERQMRARGRMLSYRERLRLSRADSGRARE